MIERSLRVDISVVKDMNKLIRKQFETINAIMALHKPIRDEWFDIGSLICNECTREEYICKYPCETVQIIQKQLV